MFGTSGIRGPVGDTVTPELAVKLGSAVASWGADRVVVGRDPRPSGRYLLQAVAAGARRSGATVVDVGLAATPTIARAVDVQDADAGIAVTASHNPAPDNGFKLWLPSGQSFPPAEQAAIEQAIREAAWTPHWESVPDHERWAGATRHHREAITAAVDVPGTISVVLDLGTGAGQVTARALTDLGCDVTTIHGQPDGRFPERPSEPTADNCERLRTLVKETDADIGIAHDGDADRMRAVDHTGAFIQGDVLLAVFARACEAPGSQVAAPVNTSLAVDDVLADLNMSVTRTRVGDVFVAERARSEGVVFGGEASGSWIWPTEILCPDGPLAACKLVELVARSGPLQALVDEIDTYPLRREAIRVSDKPGVMQTVSERVTGGSASVTTIDGVRVETDDGWFLIRPSGTEPVVRITAEARTDERADALLDRGVTLVSEATGSQSNTGIQGA